MTIISVVPNGGWTEFRRAYDSAAAEDSGTSDLIELLDTIDVPIVVVRQDFRIASFNRAAADVLRLAPSDVGRPAGAIPVLSHLPNLEKWCVQVIAAGVPSRHDFQDDEKSFVLRIAPCIKSGRPISGTVLTFTNVTAFRASLDQAIYEREYTKAILNTVADPLVVLGADLRIQTANRAFHAMFDVSRESIQGVLLQEFGNRAFDLARLCAQLQETLTNDCEFQPFEVDYDFPAIGRRTLRLEARAFSLPRPSGSMILLGFQDVTAHKQAAAASARLAAIVESSSDAIVSKDLNGVITSWNFGAERIFGYAADEALGKPITILIPPERLNEETEILARIRRGERLDHYDTVRQHKDGHFLEVSLSISPLRDGGGRLVGVSKIARDITERKKAESLMQILAREVDHRAKNLLALVQATVQLTQADTAQELKTAIEGRVRALSNAHTLLAQSRWEGADLRALVTKELAPYYREGTPRAYMDGPDLILEPRLAQSVAVILHELTTNAVKYGSLSVPAGHVEVEWSRAPDGHLMLRWGETGGPAVKPPTRKGFGTRVVDQVIRAELGGEARYHWRTEGFSCEIVFPA